MDPNNLAQILETAFPLLLIGLVLVIFFILFVIPVLLLSIRHQVKWVLNVLDSINARQEQIPPIVQEGSAPLRGQMEELLGLINDLSAKMAAKDKPHHDEIRTLVTRMEHAQHLDRKKLDALSAELTGRIEELADKVEGLSAQTIENYMKEILNHLIAMQDKMNRPKKKG